MQSPDHIFSVAGKRAVAVGSSITRGILLQSAFEQYVLALPSSNLRACLMNMSSDG